MTTGSLCLTEILMSRKPCSSNSEHSHSADSTSASGVALPYFCNRRGSSEPALTPIRIGTPAAAAARAISPTLSSNFLMLPGFTRTAAHPASIAANTYFGWKWMAASLPRLTAVMLPPPRREVRRRSRQALSLPEEGDRVDDIGRHRQQRHSTEEQDDRVRERHQLEVVDAAGVAPADPRVDPRTDLFEPGDRDVTTVERQQRQQVEDADEEVEDDQQVQEHPPGAVLDRLAAEPARADHADRGVRVAGLAGQGVDERGYPLRDP